MASILGGALGAVLGICQLALAVIQFFAIMAGMQDWLGLHWMVSGLLIFPVFWIPFVGTFLGVLGAVTAWHWEWWQALLLFFGPQIAIVAIFVSLGAAEAGTQPRRSF